LGKKRVERGRPLVNLNGGSFGLVSGAEGGGKINARTGEKGGEKEQQKEKKKITVEKKEGSAKGGRKEHSGTTTQKVSQFKKGIGVGSPLQWEPERNQGKRGKKEKLIPPPALFLYGSQLGEGQKHTVEWGRIRGEP